MLFFDQNRVVLRFLLCSGLGQDHIFLHYLEFDSGICKKEKEGFPQCVLIFSGTEGDGLSCKRDIQFERRIINEVDTEVLMDAFHLALQCGRPVAGLHGLGIQTDDRGRRGQLKDDCCK